MLVGRSPISAAHTTNIGNFIIHMPHLQWPAMYDNILKLFIQIHTTMRKMIFKVCICMYI